MDIYHEFWIDAPAKEVFRAVVSAEGLNAWWTLNSEADARRGGKYSLGFGPGYDWEAVVAVFEDGSEIEWELTAAAEEWLGSRVGLKIVPAAAGVTVRFHHSGWPDASEHFRISSFCWAMYLRLLKKYVETGDVVPYEDRLKA